MSLSGVPPPWLFACVQYGHLILGHDAALGPEPRIVVAGIVAELLPLAVGHLELRDVERVELDDVHRPLARFAVAEVVAHLETSRRGT